MSVYISTTFAKDKTPVTKVLKILVNFFFFNIKLEKSAFNKFIYSNYFDKKNVTEVKNLFCDNFAYTHVYWLNKMEKILRKISE